MFVEIFNKCQGAKYILYFNYLNIYCIYKWSVVQYISITVSTEFFYQVFLYIEFITYMICNVFRFFIWCNIFIYLICLSHFNFYVILLVFTLTSFFGWINCGYFIGICTWCIIRKLNCKALWAFFYIVFNCSLVSFICI